MSNTGKTLQDMMKAYLAIEGILKCPLTSEETRQKVAGFKVELEEEISRALHEQPNDHSKKEDSTGPRIAAD